MISIFLFPIVLLWEIRWFFLFIIMMITSFGIFSEGSQSAIVIWSFILVIYFLILWQYKKIYLKEDNKQESDDTQENQENQEN